MCFSNTWEFVLTLNSDQSSWTIQSYSKHLPEHRSNKYRLSICQVAGVIKMPDNYLDKPITILKSAFHSYTYSLYQKIHHKHKPISATKVVLPSKLERIEYPGMMICPKVKNINIPISVKVIEAGIGGGFQWWASLEEIELPYGIKEINSIFFSCRNLEKVIIPNTVESINSEAFKYCEKLTNIDIPNSVKVINKEAFCSCRELRKITIPDSVSTIGAWAFNDCISLQFVIIPESVKKIDWYAFQGCNKLTIYTNHKSLPEEWERWNPDNCMVYWNNEWHYDKNSGEPVPNKIHAQSTYTEKTGYPMPREVIITKKMLKEYENVSAKDILNKFNKK